MKSNYIIGFIVIGLFVIAFVWGIVLYHEQTEVIKACESVYSEYSCEYYSCVYDAIPNTINKEELIRCKRELSIIKEALRDNS